MKSKIINKFTFRTVLVILVIIVASLGAGAALASTVIDYIDPGWNTSSGLQYWTNHYQFNASHQTWLSSNRETAYAYDTHYWNGDSESEYYVFGPLWITDQETDDYQSFLYFVGMDIDGCNIYSSSTNLYMYDLRTDYNEYVWYEQIIYDTTYGDPDVLSSEDMIAVAWY